MDKTTSTKAYVGAAVAVVSTGVTTAVALITMESEWFIPLTILSAMLGTAGTYLGVWQTTNRPVGDHVAD